MPLSSIHLLSLTHPEALPSLLHHIRSHPSTQRTPPLVIAKPIRWIITPEHVSPSSLLKPRWDLLLIIEDTSSSTDLITSIIDASTSSAGFKVSSHFTLKTGIPSRLTKSFLKITNPELLHPKSLGEIPQLTGALKNPIVQDSSQSLSLSPDLQSWIGTKQSTLPVHGAVSMLNLLAFKPGEKQNYLKYGAAFAETIGAKRGGIAKLVGNIIHEAESSKGEKGKEKEGAWHEFALAHYPSILHFADMLGSEDYQEVNQRWRVPSLADTCILCCSELEVEGLFGDRVGDGGKVKL